MARIFIGNVKGPKGDKGDKGDQGLPGLEAVPTDEAIAANLTNTIPTATQDALRRRALPNGGLFVPSDWAALKWRGLRDKARAGLRQGHVAVLGDSIAFGAAGSGATPPKWSSSWPGRLRALLDDAFGAAGSGLVIADAQLRANPTWDPRYAFTGTVTDQGFGFHQAACFRLAAGSGRVDFTATCDEFVLYTLASSGGVASVQVDGGTAKTIRNYSGGGTVDLERESGYHPGQIVTRIPAGAAGVHTLRVIPPASGSDLFLVGVDARLATPGAFRVSNPSINGKSLQTLLSSQPGAETTGLTGLPLIDMLRADLLVIALGTNDWQGARTISTLKADLTTVIRRQRATGTATGGGANAAGDVLLVWNPQPDTTALQPAGGPSWDEYRAALYDIALTENVPLLDMGQRWKDIATATSLGMITDGIHPGDAGSLDMAPAVYQALMTI